MTVQDLINKLEAIKDDAGDLPILFDFWRYQDTTLKAAKDVYIERNFEGSHVGIKV